MALLRLGYTHMKYTCKTCNVEFERYPSQPHDFCSRTCYNAKPHNLRHGHSQHGVLSLTYISWRDMKRRCLRSSCSEWKHYGGRGIALDPRWWEFKNFLEDMGEKPGKEYSIERIDNDGDYELSNCKWLKRVEQSRNRSNTFTAEEDQRLKDEIAKGLNFTQIAAAMGMTKGSVTGRAYRIGLKSGVPPIPKKDRKAA
jgi:hypothetical protein